MRDDPKSTHGGGSQLGSAVDPSAGSGRWIPAGWGPDFDCNLFLATACVQAQENALIQAHAARTWREVAQRHTHGSQAWAQATVEFLFAAAFAQYWAEQARETYATAFYRIRVYPMAGGDQGGGSMAGGEQGGGYTSSPAALLRSPETGTVPMAGGEQGGGFCGDADGNYALYGAARAGGGKLLKRVRFPGGIIDEVSVLSAAQYEFLMQRVRLALGGKEPGGSK